MKFLRVLQLEDCTRMQSWNSVDWCEDCTTRMQSQTSVDWCKDWTPGMQCQTSVDWAMHFQSVQSPAEIFVSGLCIFNLSFVMALFFPVVCTNSAIILLFILISGTLGIPPGFWVFGYTDTLFHWFDTYRRPALSLTLIGFRTSPWANALEKGIFQETPGDRTIALEDSLCCTFTLLEAWFPIS